jgi:hypothetical protein
VQQVTKSASTASMQKSIQREYANLIDLEAHFCIKEVSWATLYTIINVVICAIVTYRNFLFCTDYSERVEKCKRKRDGAATETFRA